MQSAASAHDHASGQREEESARFVEATLAVSAGVTPRVGGVRRKRAQGPPKVGGKGLLTGSQPAPAVKPFVPHPGFEPEVMSLKPVAPVE